MKALTLHQPYASLVALGVKTIETRSWPTSFRGPLAIHAGKTKADYREPVWQHCVEAPGSAMLRPELCPLPFGAVVATCTLVDVVPMVVAEEWAEDPPGALVVGQRAPQTWGYPFRDHARPDRRASYPNLVLFRAGEDEGEDVSNQLPYGDFAPGRYAWLLDDVKPTTERCPACWGATDYPRPEFGVAMDHDRRCPGGGSECARLCPVPVCPLCGDVGRCDPIPARGRQGLWDWTP